MNNVIYLSKKFFTNSKEALNDINNIFLYIDAELDILDYNYLYKLISKEDYLNQFVKLKKFYYSFEKQYAVLKKRYA